MEFEALFAEGDVDDVEMLSPEADTSELWYTQSEMNSRLNPIYYYPENQPHQGNYIK